MNRNNRIDFWRIIFTYMIVVFHFDTTFPYIQKLGLTPGWYIAVEFFFIVSGYLLYQKAAGTETTRSPWKYTLHRYRQIYPKYLLSLLLLFFVIVYVRKLSLREAAELLLDSYWELLGLQGIGLNRGWNYLNPVGWYISVLFIAGFILWYFLKKHREVFLHLIAPVFVMIAFSNLYRISGTKNAAVDIEGFYVNYALMKGMANMCLGVFAAKIKEYFETKKQVRTIKALGTAGFLSVIFLSAVKGNSNLDCFMSLILMFSVATAFLPTENRFFVCRTVRKWSKITLNIYLLHEMFRTWIFPLVFPGKHSLAETMALMCLYIVCVTVAAVLFEYPFVRKVKKCKEKTQ